LALERDGALVEVAHETHLAIHPYEGLLVEVGRLDALPHLAVLIEDPEPFVGVAL
jgi:hypothetical protein